ncbi:MAG: biotin--[acetyl-CoA-carboxylase] ligase [Christensenella sp.]|nr:biotin--[acetyl-CoA-carboxylase] ligase [Christensenella sp.]
MRKEIIETLCAAQDYISGEEISEKLNISRAAVWKHMKALKEEGAIIEAQTKKGYKLILLPDILRPEYVGIYGSLEGISYVWLSETGSTNDEAKRAARDGAPDCSIFVTEHQTQGKGRLGRKWESKPGEAIQMTFLFRPEIPPIKAPAVTFAAALGIVSAIEKVCGVQAGIKWPNDIVYQGKKLCGILTEMSSDIDRVEFIACGPGINVNQESFAEEVAQRAVSLRMITGEKIDRFKLCAAMIEEVTAYCKKYFRGGIEAIFDEYCAKSVIMEQEVQVLSGEERIPGVCKGFSADGAVLVQTENGLREFHAGEVSIRGSYGYV